MFINFRDIPGHYNLFLDYLYDYDNVADYYKYNFRDEDNYKEIFESILKSHNGKNIDLYELVKAQNNYEERSEETKKNIELLKQPNTLAIVTGQQLGLLGGPLYTIYKIITALKLTKRLSEIYKEYNFVPVFWLEAEDHDFEEVSYIKLLNANNDFVELRYNDLMEEDFNRGSVGKLKFKNSINNFIDEYFANLRNSDFTNDIKNLIQDAYKEGATFKESFSKILLHFFDKYGLLFFDIQDSNAKQYLKPVFKNEIENFRQHTNILVEKSAELEEIYHAQVKIRPINLFYNLDEGRYLIEPGENEFKLKGKRKKFSTDEILEEIENYPEKFSPNVLLRPICQDYMLPTAFYIGGPGEIAYFAQVNTLYNQFNIVPPIVMPRGSATLLEKNISPIIEKYNLNVTELFQHTDELRKKVLDKTADIKPDLIFDKAAQDMNILFDEVKEKLFGIDKTVSDSVNKYREKSLNYLNELKNKSLDAQSRKYEVVLKQVDKLIINVMPEGELQERVYNIFYYINKYGFDIVDTLYDQLEIDKFEHQIIML